MVRPTKATSQIVKCGYGDDMSRVQTFLPLHTTTRGNNRQHWRVDAKKTKIERETAFFMVRQYKLPPAPVKITLTRCGPRNLDKWNIPSALKAVIDGIADAYGIDDRHDDLLDFHFKQRKQSTYGVEVVIESD